MLNINIIYFSPTGTTETVVKSIGKGLEDKYKEFNITNPINREKPLAFNQEDIVVVGVPVYSGRVPDLLLDYFKKIKGHNSKAVLTVVYGNRDYDDALLELKDIFEKNGFISMGGAAFIGEHSYTNEVAKKRPNDNDIKTALDFGKKIKNKIINNEIGPLEVKGDYPYREKKSSQPITPETYDTCIRCGICAENCPTGAIDFSDYISINKSKCIKCCSCIKRCPVEAKHFNDERIENMKEYLIENFSKEEKVPDIFI
jgi:ferredoxin